MLRTWQSKLAAIGTVLIIIALTWALATTATAKPDTDTALLWEGPDPNSLFLATDFVHRDISIGFADADFDFNVDRKGAIQAITVSYQGKTRVFPKLALFARLGFFPEDPNEVTK